MLKKSCASDFLQIYKRIQIYNRFFNIGTVVKRIKLYNELIANVI